MKKPQTTYIMLIISEGTYFSFPDGAFLASAFLSYGMAYTKSVT